MQALNSGISYFHSEARRVVKPVIETLTPILPTFGYGEAAVKQSISSCIHEMESRAFEGNQIFPTIPAWENWFNNVNEIKLYPASRSSQLNQTQNCHIPSEQDWTIWENVTSNINQQLASWRIPFRFNISTQLAQFGPDTVNSRPTQCMQNANPEGKTVDTFVRHCDNHMNNGVAIGGSQSECLITIKTDGHKAYYAHELAHLVAPHTFDAIPLASLHPDLLEAMCDPVAHGNELITSLSYASHCRDAGYPYTSNHQIDSKGEWGPIDMTMAKLATHKTRDDLHAQIHAEGVDKSYEWIRKNYGARAAEQFVGSFVKTVFIHSMSAIVARNVKDKESILLFRTVIHVFGNMLHLGMMSQTAEGLWLNLFQYAGSGMMGRTLNALVGVVGDAALLRSFVQIMRGNSDGMMQLVYATCGTTAGAAFSNLINGFIDTCAPANHEQRQVYLDMTKPSSLFGVTLDMSTIVLDKIGVDTEAAKQNIYSRMPTLIQNVVTIDKAVANIIEQYVSLQVMTSWLWKKDQQKADAQVQASVVQLSETLGEVNVEFGPSDLPRVPTNISSFRPTQPVPPLVLDRILEDEPLMTTDAAAVTGVGSAQAASQYKSLEMKKAQ